MACEYKPKIQRFEPKTWDENLKAFANISQLKWFIDCIYLELFFHLFNLNNLYLREKTYIF